MTEVLGPMKHAGFFCFKLLTHDTGQNCMTSLIYRYRTCPSTLEQFTAMQEYFAIHQTINESPLIQM